MGFINENDIINGREGTIYITLNGNVEEAGYAKKIEINTEIKKTEVPVLGKRTVSSKASSLKHSGKMTIYYMTSMFRQIIIDYQETGKMPYFDVMITNNDPSSGAGTQIVTAKKCLLDSLVMAKLDIESDQLDEEVSFTISKLEMPVKFNRVI